MTTTPTRGRFRVPTVEAESGLVAISAAEARHMLVRRLGPGERVVLFDGAGAVVVAELVQIGPDGAAARVIGPEPATAESPLRVWLVQAIPVKLPRMDAIVRQATEVGVDTVVPVLAARSQVPAGRLPVLERKAERWRRIAAEAAKQCGRAAVPEIGGPAAWADLNWDLLPEPRMVADTGAAPAAWPESSTASRRPRSPYSSGPRVAGRRPRWPRRRRAERPVSRWGRGF